jgi:hypothetical protein
LKTGDLIFFEEMGKLSSSIQKMEESSYSRVSMIVQLPGIDVPFLYDAPPFFLAQYQFSTNKKKLLEGRFITLDSYLQSGCFKKISIRKLCKNVQLEKQPSKFQFKTESPSGGGGNDGSSSNEPLLEEPTLVKEEEIVLEEEKIPKLDDLLTARPTFVQKKSVALFKESSTFFTARTKERNEHISLLYSYISFTKEKSDHRWEKIRKLQEIIKESGVDFGSTFVNISSLFSAEMIALSYSGMGLIKEDDPTRYSFYTVQKFLELEKLEKGYFLGPEIEIKPLKTFK